MLIFNSTFINKFPNTNSLRSSNISMISNLIKITRVGGIKDSVETINKFRSMNFNKIEFTIITIVSADNIRTTNRQISTSSDI